MIKAEYLPTDENISKLLERFVVEFMPKGEFIFLKIFHLNHWTYSFVYFIC
jgi:hypothetical protein